MATGPLTDIVVLDLSRALAGPIAAMMLGDLGARVIKIESPVTGDDSRGWGPPYVGTPGDTHSSYFMSANRNKESIELDLKSDDGRAVMQRWCVALMFSSRISGPALWTGSDSPPPRWRN